MDKVSEYKIERCDEDIARLIGWATKAVFETHESHYPTFSYEDGILQALDWLFGNRDDSPADD